MIIVDVLFNMLVVGLAVLLHYEVLQRLSVAIPKMTIRPKLRIVSGVLGALLAHSLEVWLFALAYYIKINVLASGALTGEFDGSWLDYVYFSFTVYTTLGFGDIFPVGDVRFLTGIESLTGLVLITWSASYLYFEMQKYWDKTLS